jgi:hypothetical protein
MKGGHRRGLILVLMLALLIPTAVQATVVGRLTQVEGRVDLLKKGELPALPVAVGQEIGPGDVLRTKSLSTAQIKFVDDTVLDIAPESRVAIEEYLYDAAQGKRRAVLRVFRGLVHTLVSRILQMEKPDFIMKTHTGILGVRGTDWYSALGPLHTDFYNHSGTTEVSNIYPEIAGKVRMKGPQFCRVAENLPPTVPLDLTPEDFLPLQRRMSPRLSGQTGAGAGPGTGAAAPGATGTGASEPTSSALAPASETLPSGAAPSGGVIPTSFTPTGMTGSTDTSLQNPVTDTSSGIYVPPQPSPAPTQTFTFTQYSYGYWNQVATSATTANVTTGGWAERTGSYGMAFPQYYTAESSGTNTLTSGSFTSGSSLYGTYNAIMNGTVTGTLGGTLTGTASSSITSYYGNYPSTITWTGPVSIDPTGKLTFNYTDGTLTGTGIAGTVARSGTATPGTYFSQTLAETISLRTTASGSTTPPYGVATMNNTTFLSSTYVPPGGDPSTPPDPSQYNTTYPAYGTRTGYLPGTFSTTFNLTERAGIPNAFLPEDYGGPDPGATIQGVVNSATGAGFMSWNFPSNTSSVIFAGPAAIASSGALSATMYGNIPYNNGTSAIYPASGSWIQTPVPSLPSPSTYLFTQYYYGTQWIFANSPTAGDVQGMGWGFRTSVYPCYFSGYEYGNKTATGGLPSANFDVVGTMTGSVTGVLGGQTLTGTMTFTNNPGTPYSFTYTGPVTLTPEGKLTFTYSNGTWSYNGLTGTASGTLTCDPGSYFSQTTSGTYTFTNQGTNQGVVVDSTPLSGSRSYAYSGPVTQSLAVNLNSSSTLPPSGTGNITVSSQGVLTGNGQDLSGVATSTTTLTGTLNKTVTTTGNVQGRPTNMVTTFFTYTPSGDSVWGATGTIPSGSGQTPVAFATAASGSATLAQTGVDTVTTPTPLSGTAQASGGVSTPVNVNLNITNTLSSVSAGPVSLNTNLVGAVAGPTAGAKTGFVNLGASYSNGSNTANLGGIGPATLSATNTLTATATGVSPTPPHPVTSTTILTVTPK